jgi:hypothetical protein
MSAFYEKAMQEDWEEDEEQRKAGNVECEFCGEWSEPSAHIDVEGGEPCSSCQDEAFHKAK